MTDFVFKLPGDAERLRARLHPRKKLLDRSLIEGISRIFRNVEVAGDHEIRLATLQFDQVEIDSVAVSGDYANRCISGLSAEFRAAVDAATANIRQVNEALMPEPEWSREIRPGTVIGEKTTPLESVGLYVPATKGPLVSTALMLVAAAKVAGVEQIVVAMPPQSDGRANPSTVAAAKLAGADVFVVGNGVALIAGLTLGTQSVPEVDGMYGPGPPGIAAAMSLAFSYGKRTVVGIGPTDCAIIADESAHPDWIVHDLMCEGEHGPDSSVLLVTTSQPFADQVAQSLRRLVPEVAEKRREILTTVFGENGMGAIAIAPEIETACQVVNEFAPEHLLVACTEDSRAQVLDGVKHAGEILVGNFTPFSAANYAIGITAVLPTNGFARAFSGITARDMLKTSTIGELSEPALESLQLTIEELGKHEGLPCHVGAAKARQHSGDG